MDMKRVKKWKEDVKLELKTRSNANGWRLLLVSNGRLRPQSARHRPASEQTEDRGQSGMWFKMLNGIAGYNQGRAVFGRDLEHSDSNSPSREEPVDSNFNAADRVS